MGHADAAVLDAIKETMDKGTSFGAPCALENELASTRSDLVRSRKAEEIVQRQMESLKANQRTAETSGINRQHSSDRVRELEKPS